MAVALFEHQIAVVPHHDLLREAQADACAVGFGGVKRDEDFLDLP